MPSLPAWLLPVLGSAFALGFYDLCKKHAVNKNSVMHVLFYATLCGSAFYLLATVLWTGSLADANCSGRDFALIVLKSLLVASSWTCVYYAMRDLPISIAAPIRASSPVWTFLGGLLLFHEVPTLLQGVAMLLIFTGYYLFSVLGKLEGISFRRAREVHLILLGPILGAVIIECLSEYTRSFLGRFGGLDMVLYGVLVIIIVLFLPGGLLTLPAKIREWADRRKAGVTK